MKASLAYRIATMEPQIHPEVIDLHSRDIKYQIANIRKVPKIKANNVAEYYFANQKEEWNLEKDIPNFRPPFKEMFVEWDVPRNESFQEGIFLQVHNFDSLASEDQSFFFKRWSHKPHLLVAMFHWDSSKIWLGKPHWTGIASFIGVNQEGKVESCKITGHQLDIYPKHFIYSSVAIVGFAISFMHCKNVVRTEHREYSSPQAVKRNNAPPCIKYYVLDINPMKEVLRTEGQSESLGLKKALHICRGHFSTYSEEKPLFGKYAVTFWIPDHVRGKAEQGVVVKDYNVKPPIPVDTQ